MQLTVPALVHAQPPALAALLAPSQVLPGSDIPVHLDAVRGLARPVTRANSPSPTNAGWASRGGGPVLA